MRKEPQKQYIRIKNQRRRKFCGALIFESLAAATIPQGENI